MLFPWISRTSEGSYLRDTPECPHAPQGRRAALAAVLLATTLIAGDAYPRQPGVDALHYRFRLTIQDSSDIIQGEATIDLRFTATGIREAAFDLMQSMQVDSASATPYRHENDRLVLPVSPPSQAGERRQFTIRYHGTPVTGLRFLANKYKERVVFSENWPNKARHWLPMIDHPYDKATSEFLVTAPTRYQVIANGLLQEETDLGDGTRFTHWKQSVPIASWLNALGVAQFSVHHAGLERGIPLQTWVYRQDREAGPPWFEPTSRRAINFFINTFGPYPYEKLANIEAAGFGGGTEHASAIFYGENNILERPGNNLIVHEIAHQWFGNSVTEKDWDDVWLSEGFATYCTSMYVEHYDGRDAFVRMMQNNRKRIFDMEKAQPEITVQHKNLADMKRVLNRIIYEKGGWTLHMLRGVIGSDKFFAGMRTYYQTYRDINASTEDFRRVMEEASGQKLDWFFEQWLTRTPSPSLSGSWSYDPASKKVVLELTQGQQGPAYRLPLEINLGTTSSRVEMTAKQQSFELTASQDPGTIAVDPNTWVLADIAPLTRR